MTAIGPTSRRDCIAHGLAALPALGSAIAGTDARAFSAPANLRYGHVGLYGTYRLLNSSWVEAPDFHVVQARPNDTVMGKLPGACAAAHAAGKAVIVDAIFTSPKKEGAHLKPSLLPAYRERLSRMLDPLVLSQVHAVTLAEENVPHKGGAEVLRTLFRWTKERYPGVAVYQWYSPTGRRLNIPGRQWSALPADGWVIDHYMMTGARYVELVDGWTALGVPVVNLLWLSPAWWLRHSRAESVGWWNVMGWKTLYHQLAVSQRYDLPTGFFAFSRGISGERGPRFLGELDDADGLAFLDQVTAHLFPFVRSRAAIDPDIPDTRPDWIPDWPPES